MKSKTVDLTAVVDALEELRREVSRLGERVAALEGSAGSPTPVLTEPSEHDAGQAPAAALVPAQPPAAEGISEELILVIGAAIAAFLGKKPHIRQIRLIGSAAWAQQGRVMIQASHALSVHSARSQP